MVSFIENGLTTAENEANSTFEKFFNNEYLVNSTLEQRWNAFKSYQSAFYDVRQSSAYWAGIDAEYNSFVDASRSKIQKEEESQLALESQVKALSKSLETKREEVAINEERLSVAKADFKLLAANQNSAESIRADYQKQLEALDPAAANYATELARISELISTITGDLAKLYPEIAKLVEVMDSTDKTLEKLYAEIKDEDVLLNVAKKELAIVLNTISSIKTEMENRGDEYKFSHAAIVLDFNAKTEVLNEEGKKFNRLATEVSNLVMKGLLESSVVEYKGKEAEFFAKRDVWKVPAATNCLNQFYELSKDYESINGHLANIEAAKVAFANRMQDATGSYVKAVQFLQDVNAKIAYVTSEIERKSADKASYESEIARLEPIIADLATSIANVRAEFDTLTAEIDAALADRENQLTIITNRAAQIEQKNQEISLLDPNSATYIDDKAMIQAEIDGLESELAAAHIAYNEANATFNAKTWERFEKETQINILESEHTNQTAVYDGYVLGVANVNEALLALNEKAAELPAQKTEAEGAIAEINTVIDDIQASYAEQHGAHTANLEGTKTLIKNGIENLKKYEQTLQEEIDAVISGWFPKKDEGDIRPDEPVGPKPVGPNLPEGDLKADV
jgi:chromosome segregation ATPase